MHLAIHLDAVVKRKCFVCKTTGDRHVSVRSVRTEFLWCFCWNYQSRPETNMLVILIVTGYSTHMKLIHRKAVRFGLALREANGRSCWVTIQIGSGAPFIQVESSYKLRCRCPAPLISSGIPTTHSALSVLTLSLVITSSSSCKNIGQSNAKNNWMKERKTKIINLRKKMNGNLASQSGFMKLVHICIKFHVFKCFFEKIGPIRTPPHKSKKWSCCLKG